MRLAMSWLADFVTLPPGTSPREVADRLERAGLEVEAVDDLAGTVTGPLVLGVVREFAEEPQKNGKTIRWCQVQVDAGSDVADVRGIVCGAANFEVGDTVVVALPGTVLPGEFAISRRKTYGHWSDGMICSARELGLGDEHDGILVLDRVRTSAEMVADNAQEYDGPAVGADARPFLGLDDAVLDVAPTPDRGYAMSVRGLAREVATAFGLPFRDPVTYDLPPLSADGAWPVEVEDPTGCRTFAAVRISGFDPSRPSPEWMQRRIRLGGMRPVSLAVDVTNYVMLDLGQPLHAYDASELRGPIVVRRALPDEKVATLDGAVRSVEPADLLITDDSGPIGLAGVMGGASTEFSDATSEIVLEAAHFDSASVSRTSRRLRLQSEASRRFERGVDTHLQVFAALRAAALLTQWGGGSVLPTSTRVGAVGPAAAIAMPASYPGQVAGTDIDVATVVRRLEDVGCLVDTGPGAVLSVVPPSWRGDLLAPADLVEEVLRLQGYETLPSLLPRAPAGRGLTARQRAQRRVGRALAAAGLVETPSYPFVSDGAWDQLGLSAEDPRRAALRVVNPINDFQPLLRTTLLPGLLDALRRNAGRGAVDVGLFEIGQVFRPRPGQATVAPVLGAERRPTDEELAAQDAALPDQPVRVAGVLSGHVELPGWYGPGRAADWSDALSAAHAVATAAGVVLDVSADDHAPWHPGRCARLALGGRTVGHAGEVHPSVLRTLGLPPRTSAFELDLGPLVTDDVPVAATLSTYPVATQDVALIVPDGVAAADVEQALRDGAGPLLESLRLFDVYTGPPIPAGSRSLAYALRFRAPDRTLTAEEASAARAAAVAAAAERTGAVLRGA